jgi:glycosyltransferase involved in cell wall biosynthesis
MRIAYLADPSSNNAFYRSIAPFVTLSHRGHEVRALWVDGDRPPIGAVRDVDVIHVHRTVEQPALQLVREAKAHGAAVVWDNDDDIGSLPANLPSRRRFGGLAWERRLTGMRRVFELADLVTAPSPALIERFREHGAQRTEVIENFVPEDFLKVDRRPRSGVTIGWVAALEHRVELERIPIREALQRILDERPDVRVLTIGVGLGLRSDRYRSVKKVQVHELSESVAELDIGIAPIADVDFNRARSNVKLKEYAAAGVPWLASPIGPYAAMGEREGGRLVPDDRWYDELIRLIDKPRERRKLAKRAAKWARGETLERNVSRWETALAEAVSRARAAA